MSQHSVQVDQRGTFRIPVPGQSPVEVRLSVNNREIQAWLRDESSGGFGLYVEAEPPFAKDDIVELTLPKGRFRVRVAYVRPYEDDSRIQVVEQDNAGGIQTILDPDDRQGFCVGVEVLEDLSFFRKTAKRRRIARIFRVWSRTPNQGESSLAVISLAAWLALPTALFFAVAIAVYLGLGHGNVVTTDSNAYSATSRNGPPGSPPPSTQINKSGVRKKTLHSTNSSAKSSTRPKVSLDDLYEKTPVPAAERFGEWFRDALSKSRDTEPAGSGNEPLENGPSHDGDSLDSNAIDSEQLTPSQRTAIRRLAGEARRKLEQGVSPERVKAELRAKIQDVLRQD